MTADDADYGHAKSTLQLLKEAEAEGIEVTDDAKRDKTADALAAAADEIDALAAEVDDDTADALQDATAVVRIAARCHREADSHVSEQLHVNIFGSGGGGR